MDYIATDRRRFLKQVGATLAAGIGGAALSTPAAGASTNGAMAETTWRCCTAPRRCGTCGGDNVRYRCVKQSGPCPDFCTSCQDYMGDCYTFSATFCA